MTPAEVVKSAAMVADLISRRGRISAGGNPHNFLELYGATLVEMMPFEPDPRTYRHEYYYHTILNRLYRRVVTARRDDGVIKAQWVPCSD